MDSASSRPRWASRAVPLIGSELPLSPPSPTRGEGVFGGAAEGLPEAAHRPLRLGAPGARPPPGQARAVCGGGIFDCGLDVSGLHFVAALAVDQQQSLVGQDVDEAGHARAGAV